MPDIYEMNTFDLRASFPSVRVRRYEEAIMSYRSALVLVVAFCALPVAAFNAPAPLAHSIISSSSSSSHSRAPFPLCADQLPTEPIRAPRRIKGDKPRNWDKGLSESKKRRIVRGGSLGPKGKAAVAARPQGRANQLRELQRLTITGGTARGRRLITPGVYMRPMMSRVREALFSMLYPAGVLRDSARHLDLFAGSGVVGLEALSRGVGSATFVDFSNVCCDAIRSNAESIDVSEKCRVVEARVDTFLAEPSRYGVDQPFDIVAITPPYEEVVYSELIQQLCASDAVGEDTLVVVEYPVELGCFPPILADGQLVGLRNRRYGRTVIGLYVNRPSGKLDYAPFSEEFVKI